MTSRRAMLAVGVASFLIFILIAGLVFSHASQSADASLALSINNTYLGGLLTSLMVFASDYGREYFWIPIVAIMALLGGRETKLLALELAVLFIAGIAAGEALKHLAYRARPYEVVSGIVLRLPGDTDSSFPSGHALIVSIGAAFSLVKFRSKALALLLTLEAAIVCYSRVYTGMHYPLDVLAGVALGVAIVGVGLAGIDAYLLPLLSRLVSILVKALKEGPLHL